MLGLGWWTGSNLEEKGKKGFRQGHSTQVSPRKSELWCGGNHLLDGNALLEARAGSCGVRGTRLHRACALVLCRLTPSSQVSGMSSLVPTELAPLGLWKSASLVSGHSHPLLLVLLLTPSLLLPQCACSPALIHTEAQALSFADETRV